MSTLCLAVLALLLLAVVVEALAGPVRFWRPPF